jgi:competence protein ComGC
MGIGPITVIIMIIVVVTITVIIIVVVTNLLKALPGKVRNTHTVQYVKIEQRGYATCF